MTYSHGATSIYLPVGTHWDWYSCNAVTMLQEEQLYLQKSAEWTKVFSTKFKFDSDCCWNPNDLEANTLMSTGLQF